MKKVYLFTSALLLSAASVSGQVVEEKQTALLAKRTATWCNPCGTWGWTMFNEIYDQKKDEAILIEVHDSGTSQLHAPGSHFFKFNYAPQSTGTPDFFVNSKMATQFTSSGSVLSNATRQKILFMIDSTNATSPIANSATLINITSTHIEATTKTKFFQNASGEYYVAVYFSETDVVKYQSGIGQNAVHKNPYRGTVHNLASGPLVVNGNVMAGEEFTNTTSIAINPDLNLANVQFFTVIWKMRADGKYDHVNASKTAVITGVKGVETAGFSANIFPTIATPGQRVNLHLDNTTGQPITVHIYDQLGRSTEVLTEQAITGSSTLTLNKNHNLAAGVYFVSISQANSERKTLKFVVNE